MIRREKNIHELLRDYRDKIKNPRDFGTKFERLMKSFLTKDPQYATQFKKVWLWGEWPEKWGPDCGIDLVAETHNGEYAAIQCKCYAEDHQMRKEDIDSFFNESGKTFEINGGESRFSSRIIISTSSLWSDNAERSIHNQSIETLRIDLQTLDQSPIDWSEFNFDEPTDMKLRAKKTLRDHQSIAIENVIKGLKSNDRGKVIMACGTGKTFTSLRLAERYTKSKGNILFLVPSISLMSQTLREWTAESEKAIRAYAVCSDSKVGKSEDMSRNDLAIPANTDASSLAKAMKSQGPASGLTVVFATYHSIKVVSDAQKEGAPDFDLIICDEAHRTTGVTLAGEDESHFVKVHDENFLKGKKRVYMTATPRLYGESAKVKADEAGAEICSMDDIKKFGPEFHRLGFGEAVSKGLLSDYKVLVLAVDERYVSQTIQKSFKSENGDLELPDIVKIIGCWNGLSKQFIGDGAAQEDRQPMKRAVAFAQRIKDSEKVASLFQEVVNEYIDGSSSKSDSTLKCEVEHVDGSFNVLERNKKLQWLKEDAGEDTCRILSNARCLSEGVDVPALDAVLFLNPRDSQVDVVQSVGRIMRQSPGKKYGYVILPIPIPAGVQPEDALKDQKKYKVVWQVLQALRSHDDRFNAVINQIELNKTRPDQIQIIGIGGGQDQSSTAAEGNKSESRKAELLAFPEIKEWKDAIFAKIVVKCGSRVYWEQWAGEVANIAAEHISQIKIALKTKSSKIRDDFENFLKSTQSSINSAVTEEDAIEMLAQHLVTKPVFDALFGNYRFTELNPVSKVMQKVVKSLEGEISIKDFDKMNVFYDSVKQMVEGIDNSEARQNVIVKLYEKFFKVAFPKDAERLGIVYTPIEVVDFIIKSIDSVMKSHFNKHLSDAGVHVLDPFTGTGTFIVRLLQSGLIQPSDLKRKFSGELHANEIVLLAYYIAAINIEESYHSLTNLDYEPFKGVVLTDTFQSTESLEDALTLKNSDNDARLANQKKVKINVILGNPPYSVGQGNANDNNKNLKYPKLDARIRETYVAESTSTLKNSLYDSYIRAMRWATDRIGDTGIIGFVTNGQFIDNNSTDGLRKALRKEFAKIYCFNLRGNARTQGEQRKRERGNIFGSGSRTPVAITIFVKDNNHVGDCEIFYYDIGDFLTREEKLAKIQSIGSIDGIFEWQNIKPNLEGDWISHRDTKFEKFLSLGSKENYEGESLFTTYSCGVKTNRDAWVYNFNAQLVAKNMEKMIDFFNAETHRYQEKLKEGKHTASLNVENFVNSDLSRIKWTRELFSDVVKGRYGQFKLDEIVTSLYRPFTKQYLYFSRRFNNTVYLMPRLFPTPNHQNIVIGVAGMGASKDFSCLATNTIPNLHFLDTSQSFPLYYYRHIDELSSSEKTALKGTVDTYGFIRFSAISSEILELFRSTYKDEKISSEDLFYYTYAVLHSPIYRSRFQSDLRKMLPRIPYLSDFWGYSKAGGELAILHLDYESVEPFKFTEEVSADLKKDKNFYRVSKLRHPKIDKLLDRSVILYNSHIKIMGIPLETYEYIVNGKSALDWVIERYEVTTDKNSGIVNDPNEWSENPRYIIDLIGRIISVSLKTNQILKNLPPFEILEVQSL